MSNFTKKHMPKKISRIGMLNELLPDLQDEIWSFCGDQFPINKYDPFELRMAMYYKTSDKYYKNTVEICAYERLLNTVTRLVDLYSEIESYYLYYFDFVYYLTSLLLHHSWYQYIFPHYKKIPGLMVCIAKDILSNDIYYCDQEGVFATPRRLNKDIFRFNKKYYLKYLNNAMDFDLEYKNLIEKDIAENTRKLSRKRLNDRIIFLTEQLTRDERKRRFNIIYRPDLLL